MSFRDLARSQTWNLLSRNQVLYSIELRGHSYFGMQKYVEILNHEILEEDISRCFLRMKMYKAKEIRSTP